MEKKNARKSKWFTAFIVLNMVVAIVALSLVLGKYTNSKQVTGAVHLEDFEAALVPKIDDAEVNAADIAADGTIILTLNQYQNFTLDLDYEGNGRSYIRVLIEESWIKEDAGTQTVLMSSGSSTYTIDSGTIKSTDGYMYVQGIVSGTQTIPVIEGVAAAAASGATHVKLSIKVEAIQYNRIQAFWGFSTPPIS